MNVHFSGETGSDKELLDKELLMLFALAGSKGWENEFILAFWHVSCC